jgi:adenine specific DNA methylase Mod
MVRLHWVKKENSLDVEKIRKSIDKYENTFEPIKQFKPSKRYKTLDTFSAEGKKELWKNKLFWGENLKVLYYLLNYFEEKIDLIYIDPPFFSGSNYEIAIKEGVKDYETIAYFDKWENNIENYLQMLYERLLLLKRILSPTGLLFIHLDWHASHYIRILLDEIFGADHFINSIVWYYYNKYSAGRTNLPRAHDEILLYSKGDIYTFNELRIPREKPIKQLKREMVDGVLKNAKDENGNVIYRIVKDKKLDDVWRIPCMQPASKQWTGYPTQKHHKLLERIIKLGSNEGDLIADFFCGSGTTLYAAEKLNRRWIGADNSKYAIYLTIKRIVNYQNKISADSTEPAIQIPFELYTHLTQEKRKILNSNFFLKNFKIKRKK